jgi:hypothetical protein
MATTTQTATSSLRGHRFAPCTAIHPKGRLPILAARGNRNGLLSPDGNFRVKSPDILEGLFEKSFCSTKLVIQFLHS